MLRDGRVRGLATEFAGNKVAKIQLNGGPVPHGSPNQAFTAGTGIPVRASYAASSALAKQIAQGAPADVYASADVDWMDDLDQRKLVLAGTRVDLLGNRLVVIAAKDGAVSALALDLPSFTSALRPRA